MGGILLVQIVLERVVTVGEQARRLDCVPVHGPWIRAAPVGLEADHMARRVVRIDFTVLIAPVKLVYLPV